MRITSVREITVPLEGNVANAFVNFSEHTISLVALQTDVLRNGKPVTGYALDSIGRFAQSDILRERMIPRFEAAKPDRLLDASGKLFDPQAVLQTVMRNEKPGGHGDRAAAAGAIELAVWNLNVKLLDEPGARHHRAPVRTSGQARRRERLCGWQLLLSGRQHAAPRGRIRALSQHGLRCVQDEDWRRGSENGYRAYRGGDDGREGRAVPCRRCERCFDFDTALAYAEAITPFDLRWYEEIGNPLDFDLNRQVAQAYAGRIATGENLFSVQDVTNLAMYGGMRPGKDYFQMDPGLAYGLTEYARMIDMLEERGFDRADVHPHGGHLINLHIAVGLELGGCEAYPGVFQPFGGYAAGCGIGGELVRPTDAPGFGLEEKDGLRPWLARFAD